jgi:hypothetical protein
MGDFLTVIVPALANRRNGLTLLRTGEGMAAAVSWLTEQLTAPASRRRALIDAHAPYAGQPHRHSHDHSHSHDAHDHPQRHVRP